MCTGAGRVRQDLWGGEPALGPHHLGYLGHPGHLSRLTLSTSPRLTQESSASWGVQAQLPGPKKAAGRGSSSPWDLHPPDFPPHPDANPRPRAAPWPLPNMRPGLRAQPGTSLLPKGIPQARPHEVTADHPVPRVHDGGHQHPPAASACTLPPGNRPALQGHMCVPGVTHQGGSSP